MRVMWVDILIQHRENSQCEFAALSRERRFQAAAYLP